MKRTISAMMLAGALLAACAPQGAQDATRFQGVATEWKGGAGTLIVPYEALFDAGYSYPRPSATKSLRGIADVMVKDPGLSLVIRAHDHSDGRPHKSLVETEKRAVAIQSVLVSAGVDISRVRAFGVGDIRPVSSNYTPEGQAENRRIEFVFSKGE